MAQTLNDIFLETLVYDKTEINKIFTTFVEDVIVALDEKIDKTEIEVSSGIATLDNNVHVKREQLPYATFLEADDPDNKDTLISPETMHRYGNREFMKNSASGQPSGFAPLDLSNKIPVSYLYALPAVNSYYVATEAEMFLLPNIIKGDRVIVWNDPTPSKNHEYVALYDLASSPGEYGIVPPHNSVSSVNGQTGAVVIDKTNTPDIQTNVDDIFTMNSVMNSMQVDISDNTTSIINLQTTVINNSTVLMAVQDELALTVANAIDIDTIIYLGKYRVNTNLPDVDTISGYLTVIRGVSGASNENYIYQTYRDISNEGKGYSRFSVLGDGSDWSSWEIDKQTQKILDLESSLPFVPLFKYDKVIPGDITPPVDLNYVLVHEISVSVKAGATYEIKLNTRFKYNSTINAAMFRFSTDDGVTWQEFTEKATDTTDIKEISIIDIIEAVADGNTNVLLEAKKSHMLDVLEIPNSIMIVERKA